MLNDERRCPAPLKSLRERSEKRKSSKRLERVPFAWNRPNQSARPRGGGDPGATQRGLCKWPLDSRFRGNERMGLRINPNGMCSSNAKERPEKGGFLRKKVLRLDQ